MEIRLSPSALSLFTECPRCFWLKTRMKIRRPSTIFPSLPGGMDRILKKHFDAHRRDSALPRELAGLRTIKGIEGSLFSDMEKLKDWRNNFRGLRYTDPETGATLMGALDDLFVTKKDRYAPLDFKTRGYPLKEDTHTHYQDQMDIYSFLLEKNSLPPADFAILVFYYPDRINEHSENRENRDVTFDSEVKVIPTSPSSAKDLFHRAVKTLQSPAPPEPSKDCEFCRWLGDVNGYQHEHQAVGATPEKERNNANGKGLGKWM